jgi:hypothetical protein
MRIILASPLYPPDIAEPAPYIKELASRLAKEQEIVVVAYTRLPEEVPGVRIVAISKHHPLLIRLIAYTFALWKEALKANIIYAQNGASVELPIGLVARLTRKPLIIGVGDKQAHQHATKKMLFRQIEHFAFSKAKNIIRSEPLARPEILPFEPVLESVFISYKNSWEKHIAELQNIFKKYV